MSDEPYRTFFASPLVEVGEFRCPVDHPQFAARPARGYRFVFPRHAVWIQHEGREPFVADPTTVPLYNPGKPYWRGRISDDGDHSDWFGVAPSLLREMLQTRDHVAADAESDLFRFDYSRVPAHGFLRQRQLATHVRSGERVSTLYVEEAVITLLDLVLSELYGRPPVAPLTRGQRALVEAAKAYLNGSYASQEGLNAVARAVGVSAFHLCRIFRRHEGLTIHQYRSELRLRRSLALLEEPDEDILTIAVLLGYSGHSHFTSAFRRAFGLTPSQFRMQPRRTRASVVAHGVPPAPDASRVRRDGRARPTRCHVAHFAWRRV